MKFIKKNLGSFFIILLSCILAGSLFWEILEKLLQNIGISWSLTTEYPIQLFDVYVLSISIRANPGSFIGAIAGVIFFKVL